MPASRSLSALADSSKAAPDSARLRSILEAIPFGVSLEDESGRTLLSNPAALRLAALHEQSVETALLRLPDPDGDLVLRTFADVSEHRRVAQDLFERAYIDPLTGLPNRLLFERSVQQLLETIGPDDGFAIAFIDVDNFKHINDYYSHAAGDALLVKIADRIASRIRATDVLARIGGDEFILLITPLQGSDALCAEIDAISARLKDPYFIEGHEVLTSCSVGVSLYPQHGTDADALTKTADCAMYRAKAGVKGQVVLFDTAMSHAAAARSELEQRFRLAIRDRRYTCAYQPKVDIRSQRVVGVEVLLRWRDELGLIQPPGDFVALAIELGLINEVALNLLDQVVEALADIDDVFGPEVSISLNVAAKQAADRAFMSEFCDRLAATGMPERFMVEITEEAFLERDCFQRTILPLIRRTGARVSIDDFGVGYSSLAALADITADEIKIDRSFIRDIHKRPRNQSILKAIESLAQALGMSVVAEGVETLDELIWLQASTGIRAAQGYYFSKPILLEEARRRTPNTKVCPAHLAGRASPSSRPSVFARR